MIQLPIPLLEESLQVGTADQPLCTHLILCLSGFVKQLHPVDNNTCNVLNIAVNFFQRTKCSMATDLFVTEALDSGDVRHRSFSRPEPFTTYGQAHSPRIMAVTYLTNDIILLTFDMSVFREVIMWELLLIIQHWYQTKLCPNVPV